MKITEWRKATASHLGGIDQGECVQIGAGRGVRAIRDSKDPDGPQIALTPAQLRAFVAAVRER